MVNYYRMENLLWTKDKVSFVCKPCHKSWQGEFKRLEFMRHCDSQFHCLAINNLLKKKTAKEINNGFCYEEIAIGFEKNKVVIDESGKQTKVRQTIRIGFLHEDENDDDDIL